MLEIENKTGTTRIKMDGLGGKSETEEMHQSTKMALYQSWNRKKHEIQL
jgi:hypothetical protein